MRKLFLAFLLFGCTLTAFAQNPADDDWSQGHYYDKSGKRTDGLIADYYLNPGLFNSNIDYFSFKPDKRSKYSKIYTKDINSFVVAGVDSFVVSNSTALKKPIIAVVADNKIKLYATEVSKFANVPSISLLVRAFDKKYLDCTYYYGPDPNNLTQITRKNFKEAMARVLAEKPDQYSYIKDKTFTYDNIDKLAVFFKTGQVSLDDDTNTGQQ